MNTEKGNNVDQLIEGKTYLWLKRTPGGEDAFQEVVFIKYKPHPGEVWVICAGRRVSVHRRFLFFINGSAD